MPRAPAMARAVATVGSARPFFSWFTCARSSAARDASSPSVQPRAARTPERLLRLTDALCSSGAGGGTASRSARPARRAPPRRGTRHRAADWRPRPGGGRAAAGAAAYAARARPRRCPVLGAAPEGGSPPLSGDGAARPDDGSRYASRQGARLHRTGTSDQNVTGSRNSRLTSPRTVHELLLPCAGNATATVPRMVRFAPRSVKPFRVPKLTSSTPSEEPGAGRPTVNELTPVCVPARFRASFGSAGHGVAREPSGEIRAQLFGIWITHGVSSASRCAPATAWSGEIL